MRLKSNRNEYTMFKYLIMSTIVALFYLGNYASGANAATCEKVDQLKIQEYPGSIANLVPWAAVDEGIFKKYCISAVFVPIPSAPAAYAASLQGGVNIIGSSPETAFIPADQGMDIKVVAAKDNALFFGLAIGKDVPLPHEQDGFPALMVDLKDKTNGVNAFGSNVDAVARANFEAAGIDPDKIKWVAYGSPAAALAALKNGSIDAVELFGDTLEIAQKTLGARIVGDLRDPATKTTPAIKGLNGANTLWVAQTSFVQENPDLIKRFKEANNEAVEWIKDPANFDAILKIVSKRSPNPEGFSDDEELLKARVTKFIPVVSSTVSTKALQAWSNWDLKAGRIKKPADLDTLVWKDSKDIIVP